MIKAFVIWTLFASLTTAAMYVWDKRAASRDRSRVSERSLLVASLLGGWPGGWIAGQIIRHKTAKLSYRIKFVAVAIAHVALSIALWGLISKGS